MSVTLGSAPPIIPGKRKAAWTDLVPLARSLRETLVSQHAEGRIAREVG